MTGKQLTLGDKCLYCSTSESLFGPAFELHEDIESFLGWLNTDARKLTNKELDKKVLQWRLHYYDLIGDKAKCKRGEKACYCNKRVVFTGGRMACEFNNVNY